MNTTGTIASLAIATALTSGLALSPAIATGPQTTGATQAASTKVVAKKKVVKKTTKKQWPWMSVGTWHKVQGRTLTYRYSEAGYQYLAKDGGRTFALPGSAGYTIDFGDGRSDGGNGTGGATCLRKGRVVKFNGRTPNLTHRYAKPGKYKVRITGYYCGVTGHDRVTQSYWVTVR